MRYKYDFEIRNWYLWKGKCHCMTKPYWNSPLGFRCNLTLASFIQVTVFCIYFLTPRGIFFSPLFFLCIYFEFTMTLPRQLLPKPQSLEMRWLWLRQRGNSQQDYCTCELGWELNSFLHASSMFPLFGPQTHSLQTTKWQKKQKTIDSNISLCCFVSQQTVFSFSFFFF